MTQAPGGRTRWRIVLGLIASGSVGIALLASAVVRSCAPPASALSARDGGRVHSAPLRRVQRRMQVEQPYPLGVDSTRSRVIVEDQAPKLPTTFQVLAESGEAVAEAEVLLFDKHDTQIAHLRTDAAGLCPAAPTQVVNEIAVRRHGFATFVAPLESLPIADGRMLVRLSPGEIIRGWVRRPSGGAPQARVLVTAWPAGTLVFSPRETRLAEVGDARFLTTWTDASGSFEIAGAPRGAELRLVAAGDGMMQTTFNVTARAGYSRHVSLEVVPIFVLDAVLVDAETGDPIRAMGTNGLGGLAGSFAPRDTIGHFTPATPGLAWAGLHPPVDATGDGRVYRVYGIDIDADECDPISLNATAPGYEAAHAEVPAHRVRKSASPPSYEFPLVRTSTGFGTIEVSLGTAAEAVRSGLSTSPPRALLVELRSMPSGNVIRVGLPGIGRRPVTIVNVPEGRYQARIKIPLGLRSACSELREFVVERERTAALAWDLADAAAIEIRARTSDGVAIEGPLSILIRRRGSNVGGSWGFDSGPYVIAGVEPGAYEILATDFIAVAVSTWTPVDAAAGAAAHADVTLGRRR